MINNHRYFRRNGILTTKGYYPLSLGRGTQLLSRLDQMFFEHSLPVEYEKNRGELFTHLLRKNSSLVQNDLYELAEIVDLPTDTGHPVLETAQRILKYADRSNVFINMKLSSDKISKIKNIMKDAIGLHDYDTLQEKVHLIEK